MDAQSTLVRFATESDIATLQAMDRWPAPAVWRRKIDACEVLVADLAGTVVGLLRFEYIWTTVPFISLISVQESLRRQGIGKAMLRFLMRHLKENCAVALLSSSQTNEPEAQAWHIHQGFRSNGIIENIADDGVGELIYRIEL